MCSASVWLLSLVLCWGFPSPHTTLSYAAVYYVTPHSPNPDCPSGEPCLTINEYAQGHHFDGDDNITLLFLNGEHNLTDQSLIIQNKTSLKMAPSHAQTGMKTQITFKLCQNIWIKSAHIVELFGLNFSCNCRLCGGAIIDTNTLSVSSVSIKTCQFILTGLVKATLTELSAINNTVIDCSLSTANIFTITNSNFTSSQFNYSGSLDTEDESKMGVSTHKSSSMNNSDAIMRAKSSQLLISNTVFTVAFDSTGININGSDSGVLQVFIKNCTLNNYFTQRKSSAALTIITNAVTVISITSTIFFGATLFVSVVDSSETTLSMFNCSLNGEPFFSYGVKIDLNQTAGKYMFLNITKCVLQLTGIQWNPS